MYLKRSNFEDSMLIDQNDSLRLRIAMMLFQLESFPLDLRLSKVPQQISWILFYKNCLSCHYLLDSIYAFDQNAQF